MDTDEGLRRWRVAQRELAAEEVTIRQQMWSTAASRRIVGQLQQSNAVHKGMRPEEWNVQVVHRFYHVPPPHMIQTGSDVIPAYNANTLPYMTHKSVFGKEEIYTGFSNPGAGAEIALHEGIAAKYKARHIPDVVPLAGSQVGDQPVQKTAEEQKLVEAESRVGGEGSFIPSLQGTPVPSRAASSAVSVASDSTMRIGDLDSSEAPSRSNTGASLGSVGEGSYPYPDSEATVSSLGTSISTPSSGLTSGPSGPSSSSGLVSGVANSNGEKQGWLSAVYGNILGRYGASSVAPSVPSSGTASGSTGSNASSDTTGLAAAADMAGREQAARDEAQAQDEADGRAGIAGITQVGESRDARAAASPAPLHGYINVDGRQIRDDLGPSFTPGKSFGIFGRNPSMTPGVEFKAYRDGPGTPDAQATPPVGNPSLTPGVEFKAYRRGPGTPDAQATPPAAAAAAAAGDNDLALGSPGPPIVDTNNNGRVQMKIPLGFWLPGPEKRAPTVGSKQLFLYEDGKVKPTANSPPVNSLNAAGKFGMEGLLFGYAKGRVDAGFRTTDGLDPVVMFLRNALDRNRAPAEVFADIQKFIKKRGTGNAAAPVLGSPEVVHRNGPPPVSESRLSADAAPFVPASAVPAFALADVKPASAEARIILEAQRNVRIQFIPRIEAARTEEERKRLIDEMEAAAYEARLKAAAQFAPARAERKSYLRAQGKGKPKRDRSSPSPGPQKRGKYAKGSQEAKDFMARLRLMRKKK